ncbi:glycosyltransferase family 2 protein [Providencia huaxiensis]|uniref:glycosyltransferase family 2 protein n=1 Tax=Providencia huaxiensis TaxID=2027290 RepID=UPI0032DAA4B3
MAKVSVVVPVYNVEKYITRSLLSLFNQTLDNIEIIIINDGSTDNSLSIVKDIIKNNSKDNTTTTLISRENRGLVATRAEGINIATGDYIIHLDSDDWVEPNWLQLMYEMACKENSDIVMCDYTEIYNNKEIRSHKEYYPSKIENINSLLLGRISNSVCDKLIKRSILTDNNIIFNNNIAMGEDIVFTLQTFFYSNKISYVPNSLYYYNKINEGSLTYNYSQKSLIDIVHVIEIIESFLNSNNYISNVEKSLCRFKLKIRAQYIVRANNNYNNFLKAMNLYPEANYLINTPETSKILKLMFSINKLNNIYLNKLALRLYFCYLKSRGFK